MSNKTTTYYIIGGAIVLYYLANYTTMGQSVQDSLFSFLRYLEEGNIPALTAYQDSGGVWTIGYGSIYNFDESRKVMQNDTIDAATAERWLEQEANEKLNYVQSLINVPVTNNQLVALGSFTYNVGDTAFADSTLLKLLNNGADISTVADQFDRWIYDNGKIVNGLINRRKAEKNLFLS